MIQVIGDKLYQWDSNRQVILTGDDAEATQVHFANKCTDEKHALVVETREVDGMIVADIPNSLLMNGHNLAIYTWKDDKTIYGRMYPVTKRKKPASYIYEPTDILTMEALKKWVSDTIDELIEAGTLTDYAQLTNLPSINEVQLVGDKTFEELGAEEISEEEISSWFEGE